MPGERIGIGVTNRMQPQLRKTTCRQMNFPVLRPQLSKGLNQTLETFSDTNGWTYIILSIIKLRARVVFFELNLRVP